MAEIVRCSRRYVLCGEYFAEETTEVPYRGQDGALFKRDYGALYQELFPELALVEQGFLGRDEGWDDVTWWLFERSREEPSRSCRRGRGRRACRARCCSRSRASRCSRTSSRRLQRRRGARRHRRRDDGRPGDDPVVELAAEARASAGSAAASTTS